MIFWGTFFPLISELFTGDKSSLAAPWFDRYTTPLAILLVLFTGIGPLLAWRRVSWASAKRVFLVPAAGRRAWPRSACALFTDAADKPWALALFAFAAFALTGAGAGVLARRRGAARRSPAARCRRRWSRVVARNRRRYGGYIVHAGIAVLLIGIAASSSFQTNRDVALRPGQSAVVDGRRITYVQADRRDQPGRAEPHLRRGPHVTKDGKPFATLAPSRDYFASTATQAGSGPIGASSRARRPARWGARRPPSNDLWTAMQPDLTPLNPIINGADRRLETLPGVSPTTAGRAGLSDRQGLPSTSPSATWRTRRRWISASTSTRS